MAQASPSPVSPRPPEERSGSSLRPHAFDEPRHAFRAALGRYKGTLLAAIRLAQGATPGGLRIRPSGTADEITEHLDEPAAVKALLGRLSPGSQLALSLYGLTELTVFPLAGISQALRTLATEPVPAILPLLELGLVVAVVEEDSGLVDEFAEMLESRDALAGASPRSSGRSQERCAWRGRTVSCPGRAARSARSASRTDSRACCAWRHFGSESVRNPCGRPSKACCTSATVIASTWTRCSPRRLPTHSSRCRIWLRSGCRWPGEFGLIELEAGGERLLAAPPEFWTENEVHFPQMIATGWLSLPEWCELPAEALADNESEPTIAYLRCALLLWLSTLAESEWVALDDLAEHLTARCPAWSRLSRSGLGPEEPPPRARPPARVRHALAKRSRRSAAAPGAPRGDSPGSSLSARSRARGPRVARRATSRAVEPARPIRAGGGANAATRPAFEQFLFVQPNFEVIAYRQGLTPQLVGRLSRFAWWTQIGAALELKLSRESIVHGLDRGSKPDWMLETLTRASQRPLSRGVIEAIKNWAERRERVVYYNTTTLIEFGSQTERDQAIELWPADSESPPVSVGERFLLVEDERTVPYSRLRLTSSRDYRRPPEVCVTVEQDGVTLALDPAACGSSGRCRTGPIR